MTDRIDPVYRSYDPERDRPAAARIWREIGWVEKGKEDRVAQYIEAERALVGEVNGEAECVVLTGSGTLKYLSEDLSLAAVTGVTTSRIARKQGLAGNVLARALALEHKTGALVAGLGMFEQGYYDNLGFGALSYEHLIAFDPAALRVSVKHRIPKRLTAEHFEAMHAARLTRKRMHGSVSLLHSLHTRFEMEDNDNEFGVGYQDETGAITHALWLRPADVENGPYRVLWIVYHTRDEFLELMSLVQSWGDQVHSVRMPEPPGIQMQDLTRQPIKQRRMTRQTKFASECIACAFYQMRILDLAGCLAKTYLSGPALRFNLKLHDPVERFLESDSDWRGISGEYIVTLGADSSAIRGSTDSLPTLSASVNAFTRMWLGVRPATGLSITDSLSGPHELLEELDNLLRLPPPMPDWDF